MMRSRLAFGAVLLAAFLAGFPAHAQTSLSPEEARVIEYGKEVYKNKGNCQFCHKWDASGDTGYGGIALSLRKSFLTREQFAESAATAGNERHLTIESKQIGVRGHAHAPMC